MQLKVVTRHGGILLLINSLASPIRYMESHMHSNAHKFVFLIELVHMYLPRDTKSDTDIQNYSHRRGITIDQI